MEKLAVPWVALISMDSFYRPLTAAELERAHASTYDFDAPGVAPPRPAHCVAVSLSLSLSLWLGLRCVQSL
jgi:hypothetical protein